MIRRMALRALAGLIVLVFATATACAAEQRVALVVGVGGYKNVPHLANTVNDAKAIGAALGRLGFKVVTLTDPDRAAFESAVRAFGVAAKGADASLFFYAGHALELGGRNWLIPATAALKSERDLRFETLDLDAVLEQTDGASRVSLVFLDSCRDNPFRMQLTSVTRDVPHGGLGQVRAASGTLVAFSTAPGTVAEDGKGEHSPFTAALLKWLEKPSLEVRQMLSEVRREVREATRGRQVPWENSALEGQFFFNPQPTAVAAATPAAPPAPQVVSQGAEILFWDTVRTSHDPAEYAAYLKRFPNGTFAELARTRMAQLDQATHPEGAPARNAAPAPAPTAFDAALRAQFARALPSMPADVREQRQRLYVQATEHKAQVVASQPSGTWRSSNWDSAAEAEEAALEGCQMFLNAPCTTLATDGQVRALPAQGPLPHRDMPRVRYAGSFDPAQVPALTPALRQRADIAGYAARGGAKAAAWHPWGRRLFVAYGAANPRAAEQEALAVCNTDPTRHGEDGPCFLYAVGNQVVLPRRLTEPLTAAPQDGPTEADPFARRVAVALALVGSPDHVAGLYAKAAHHKAIAVQPDTGRTYRRSGLPTRGLAEQRALELCQLRYGSPCVLLATDDEVRTDDPRKAPRHDMERLRYAGPFRQDSVPLDSAGAVERTGYAGMPEPKAMAIHSSERVMVATGGSVAEAEAKALAACNAADPANPCFLYAVNGQVVLPQRRTAAER